MRRWMLLACPAAALGAWGLHAGGGAAGLILWMALGALILPPGNYPYPRKRGGKPWRLFFALGAGCFLLTGTMTALAWLCRLLFAPSIFSAPLMAFGAAGFATALGSLLLSLPLGKKAGWIGGGLLLGAAALLIF